MVFMQQVILERKDVNIEDLEKQIEYTNKKAPIQKGEVIGNIEYVYDGIKYRTDLIANENVEEKNVNKKASKEKDKKKDKKAKQPKKSLGSKIKEVNSELKKVSWPTFANVVKKTGVVILVVFLFTLVLFGIDFGLGWIYKLFLN